MSYVRTTRSGTLRVEGDIIVHGNIVPDADNTRDIGESGNEFKDIHIDGTGNIDAVSPSPAPAAHKTSHQNGGSDEIDVGSLSGTLADAQTPTAHDLGGAEHNADVIADVDGKISDASFGMEVYKACVQSTPDNGATEYMPITGQSNPSTNEVFQQTICTRAGTFKNLEIALGAAPGGATKTWTFTIRKNGVDQSTTVTITNTETTGQDRSNTFTVAEGDLVSVSIVPANAPAATSVALSIEFWPS